MLTEETIESLLNSLEWSGEETLSGMNNLLSKSFAALRILRLSLANSQSNVEIKKYEINLASKKYREELEERTAKIGKVELKELVKEFKDTCVLTRELLEMMKEYNYTRIAIDLVTKQLEVLKISSTNLQSLNKARFMR